MTHSIRSSHTVRSVKLPVIDAALAAHSEPEDRVKSVKTACGDCRLQSLCLAKHLKGEGLEQLNSIVKMPKPLRSKGHLYRQGDPFKSLYFVRSGFVKSYITNSAGDELAVSFYMPGEIIGLDGLYSKQHTGSVVALQDVFLCEIPYEALEKLCMTEPALQRHFSELQSRQIGQEQEMAMLRGQKTAEDRLVAFLLSMSQRYERLKLSPWSFRLPMTRKDIASCLGLTLETVSRLFTILQEKELIRVRGREVTLLNLQAPYAMPMRKAA